MQSLYCDIFLRDEVYGTIIDITNFKISVESRLA